MNAILKYFLENPLEAVGTTLSLIFIYLSVNEKVALWIFGFFSAVCYVVVFFQSKIYAGLTLQFYYIFISIYGFYNWKFGKTENTENQLIITKTKANQWIVFAVSAVLIFFAYFIVLKRFTDSQVPFGDSFATALCVVATFMLARKLLENWLIFIIADSFAVGLYIYQGLYITACLFAVYTIMGVLGYFRWKKSMI
ncbi:MAG: nicotinamide riboside transporter PnuC [Paludibacter sp.]|nr:nicotinamide riboside transporter PnuC [Paludibacter sp.]